jgi:transcriptional regulator with XRE-family HTH domain
MSKAKSKNPKYATTVCDQLRQAILASGKTHYRIGKDAGCKPEIVGRFARGERDVRAETFAKIAAALGMELTSKKGEEDG